MRSLSLLLIPVCAFAASTFTNPEQDLRHAATALSAQNDQLQQAVDELKAEMARLQKEHDDLLAKANAECENPDPAVEETCRFIAANYGSGGQAEAAAKLQRAAQLIAQIQS